MSLLGSIQDAVMVAHAALGRAHRAAHDSTLTGIAMSLYLENTNNASLWIIEAEKAVAAHRATGLVGLGEMRWAESALCAVGVAIRCAQAAEALAKPLPRGPVGALASDVPPRAFTGAEAKPTPIPSPAQPEVAS